MTITKRLRERMVTNWVHSTGTPPEANGLAHDTLCHEAADEIERLQDLEIDLVECNTRIASMRVEWGAEVAALAKERDIMCDSWAAVGTAHEAAMRRIASDDKALRDSVPEHWKGCTSAVGAAQGYIAELESDAAARSQDDGKLEHEIERLRSRVAELDINATPPP